MMCLCVHECVCVCVCMRVRTFLIFLSYVTQRERESRLQRSAGNLDLEETDLKEPDLLGRYVEEKQT